MANRDDYLGPGEVLETTPDLRVRLNAATPQEVVAQSALAFPYSARPGDQLLVFGRGDHYYAIGVLAGSGQSSLAFQGDVDLRAVGGTLNLRGEEGLSMEAPRITMRAEILRTFAHSMTEKADTTFRWVKDLLTVRAGESRRVVQGEDYSQSKRSVTLAEETVKIDGHQVHLGH